MVKQTDMEHRDPVSEDTQTTVLSSSGLVRDMSGKYRWIYELPMLKSFFLLFEVWKVLGIAFLLVMVISLVISLFSGEGLEGALGSAGVPALSLGILLVLSLPAYYIVTKANNGRYTVLFEMDDSGIDHIQIKTDKARALEVLTVFAGRATQNRTVMGAGMLSAAGSSLYSRFSGVRKIKAYPEKNLIIVNSRFIRNQVYADREDYEFVLTYIIEHCPDAAVQK